MKNWKQNIPQQVIDAIFTAYRNCKDKFAKSYLGAIPRAFREGGRNGVRTNVLYAVTNMDHWRGEVAKECKIILRHWLRCEGVMK